MVSNIFLWIIQRFKGVLFGYFGPACSIIDENDNLGNCQMHSSEDCFNNIIRATDCSLEFPTFDLYNLFDCIWHEQSREWFCHSGLKQQGNQRLDQFFFSVLCRLQATASFLLDIISVLKCLSGWRVINVWWFYCFSSASGCLSLCWAAKPQISQNAPFPCVCRVHGPTDRLSSATVRAYSRLDLCLLCRHSWWHQASMAGT